MQLIYLLGWIRKKKWIKGGHQCHLEWQCDLWQCTTNETQWYTKRCPLTFYINWEKNIGIFNENDCNTLQDLFMVNNCVYLIYRHHSMTSFRCFLNQHHLSHWKCLWWKLTICKWIHVLNDFICTVQQEILKGNSTPWWPVWLRFFLFWHVFMYMSHNC